MRRRPIRRLLGAAEGALLAPREAVVAALTVGAGPWGVIWGNHDDDDDHDHDGDGKIMATINQPSINHQFSITSPCPSHPHPPAPSYGMMIYHIAERSWRSQGHHDKMVVGHDVLR